MRALANPEKARVLAGFFKTGPGEYGEGDRFLGVAVPATRRLARAFRTLPHDASLALLDSPFNEIRLLALLVLVDRFTRGAAEERAEVCRAYLDHRARVNNWNLVDSSAPYILGAHLLDTDPAPCSSSARTATTPPCRSAARC
jgi:hypothetical protein